MYGGPAPGAREVFREMDEIEVAMADWVRWALVGYLGEKTGLVWQVDLRQEMLDVDILCTYGDVRISTGSLDFTKVDSMSALLVSIIPHMDAVAATFIRQRDGTEEAGRHRLALSARAAVSVAIQSWRKQQNVPQLGDKDLQDYVSSTLNHPRIAPLVKAQADPASIHNEVIRLLEEIMGR